ncbi:hypothetical protein Tco_0309330 [Tanacetum coccineum]
MDGVINNDESCCELKRKWNIYTNYDDAYEINHEDNENKELSEIHELPTSKVPTANKATTSTLNSFEALSTLLDEKEGSGNQPPSTNATPIVARINELERQMLDGKLVLVDNESLRII